MMSVTNLVQGLPTGYRSRQATAADAEAFCEVVRRVDLACCGESSITIDECLDDLTTALCDAGSGNAIVTNTSGSVVAVMNCFNELAHDRGLFADVFIDPRLPSGEAEGIAAALVDAATAYGRDIASTLPNDQPVLKSATYANDRAFIAALKRAGFEQHRVMWRMRVDHVEPRPPVTPPAGVKFRNHDGSDADWHTAHRVLNTAFADYYDFHEQPFDVWFKRLTGPLEELAWWRFATVDGEIVGGCIRNRRYAAEGMGYLATIGVLREFRGRGIARALLLDAFAQDQQLGFSATVLQGDSTNPTGAMSLYESVGMRADREYLAYRLPLR